MTGANAVGDPPFGFYERTLLCHRGRAKQNCDNGGREIRCGPCERTAHDGSPTK
jgi:hypothetical protein